MRCVHLAVAIACALLGCRGDFENDCEPGTENCACAAGDECLGDLECRSDVCVAGDTEPDGCADTPPAQVYGEQMVGCDGGVPQCEAAALCAEGWHLCTLAEYAALGGESTASDAARWLSACVREVEPSTVGCPGPEVCDSACETVEVPDADVAYWCAGNLMYSGNTAPLGVAARNLNEPRRIGCASAPCVFGDAFETDTALGAMCCLD